MCSIVWLTGLRHAKRRIADQTEGIENSAGYDATINKPASDSIRFEKPEVEQKERKLHKESWNSIQIDRGERTLTFV